MKFFAFNLFNLLAVALLTLGINAAPAVPHSDASIAAGIINLLNIGLVTQINVDITLDSLTTNIVSANFTVKNPLPFELTIDRVTNSAGINGTVFATFDQTFKTFIVPPFSSANSGEFGNVLLTQGIDASLSIVPLGELDIINANVAVRGGTFLGFGGISVPLDGLVQKDVKATYQLDLS